MLKERNNTRKTRRRLDMVLTGEDERILKDLEIRTGLKRTSAIRLAVREAARKRNIPIEPQVPSAVVIKDSGVGILMWAVRKKGAVTLEPCPFSLVRKTDEEYVGAFATPTTEYGWKMPALVKRSTCRLFKTEAEAEAYWRSLPDGDTFKRSINWVVE